MRTRKARKERKLSPKMQAIVQHKDNMIEALQHRCDNCDLEIAKLNADIENRVIRHNVAVSDLNAARTEVTNAMGKARDVRHAPASLLKP